jgi:uncharacterized protein (DUF169 family)
VTDWNALERDLERGLGLRRRPVAVTFHDEIPSGVARLDGAQPSSCSFWRLASEGRSFYTLPSDHYNCPVGSYTHNIPLPPGLSNELADVLGLMTEIRYLRMEEVPQIPTLPKSPAAVGYAPLGKAERAPDVVLIWGNPKALGLALEAANRAGIASSPLMTRPTCMALPIALGGAAVASSGCVGNRTYTDTAEEDLYLAISGQGVVRLADELGAILDANAKLAGYHAQRRANLSTG